MTREERARLSRRIEDDTAREIANWLGNSIDEYDVEDRGVIRHIINAIRDGKWRDAAREKMR